MKSPALNIQLKAISAKYNKVSKYVPMLSILLNCYYQGFILSF